MYYIKVHKFERHGNSEGHDYVRDTKLASGQCSSWLSGSLLNELPFKNFSH